MPNKVMWSCPSCGHEVTDEKYLSSLDGDVCPRCKIIEIEQFNMVKDTKDEEE